MDKDSWETPNPLNTGSEPTDGGAELDANPSETIQNEEPMNRPASARSIDGIVGRNEEKGEPMAEVQETVQVSETVQAPEPTGVQIQKSEPTEMPTPAQVMEPKPKKSKTGLVVGVIVCLFLAIGCGVAAFLLNMNKGDAVAKAMNKLMQNEVNLINGVKKKELSRNMTANGTISVVFNQDSDLYKQGLKSLNIDLDYKMTKQPVLVSTVANVELDFGSMDFKFEVDEINNLQGDIYLKIDEDTLNMLKSIMGTATTTQGATDCSVEETTCVTPQTTTDSSDPLSILETISGNWVRIAMSDAIEESNTDMEEVEEQYECLATFLDKNSDAFTDWYSKNPFITSSTENLAISAKRDTLYKIGFDSKNLAGYLNTIGSSDEIKEMASCFGGTMTETTTVEENTISELLKYIPDLYVEINKNYDFTRFYVSDDFGTEIATVTIDLLFDYPDSLTIEEPSEYIDIMELLPSSYSYPSLYDYNYIYDDYDYDYDYDYNYDTMMDTEDDFESLWGD